MEELKKVINWEMQLGTFYVIAGIILALAGAFAIVCGGVYLLRKSRLNEQQRSDYQKQPQSEQNPFQSDQKVVALTHSTQKQQSQGAKASIVVQADADRKYWPPSAQ
jgi:hypothetical protein